MRENVCVVTANLIGDIMELLTVRIDGQDFFYFLHKLVAEVTLHLTDIINLCVLLTVQPYICLYCVLINSDLFNIM